MKTPLIASCPASSRRAAAKASAPKSRPAVPAEPVLPDNHPGAALDPVSFADQLSRGTVAQLTMDHGINPAAEAIAAYTKARFGLIQLLPELEDHKLTTAHPFVLMDETMWRIANDAYWEGIKAGAVYENLRRAIVAPTQLCPRCEGLWLVDRTGGKFWNYDRPHPNDARPCPDCDATGLVTAERVKEGMR